VGIIKHNSGYIIKQITQRAAAAATTVNNKPVASNYERSPFINLYISPCPAYLSSDLFVVIYRSHPFHNTIPRFSWG
jgi:hypothetical protein